MGNELQVTGPKHHSQATIARAKSLYVVKGLSALEVANRMELSSGTVETWVTRYKWVEEREKRARRIEAKFEQRINDDDAAFLESLATQTEELSEDSLQLAREYVATRDENTARNLQASSQALKNFVDIYFRSRGIDGKTTGNVTLNVQNIFANGKPAEKPVFDLGKVDPPKAIE